MDNLDVGGTALAYKIWSLNEYLRNKKVPPSIKDKVRNFYRIKYNEGKLYDESELLATLPPQIKDEIKSFNHRGTFEQVPLFSTVAPETFTIRLANYITTQLVFSGEIIFEEDMLGKDMYFIDNGIVQIYSKHSNAVVKSIADGCYFGDVACLLHARRTATTQARTHVHLSVVKKPDLLGVLSDYPNLELYMLDIARNRRKRLAFLDRKAVLPPLTEEELYDDEDAKSKYFMKVEKLGKSSATVFNSARRDSQSVGSLSPGIGMRKEPIQSKEPAEPKITIDPKIFEPDDGPKGGLEKLWRKISGREKKVKPDGVVRRRGLKRSQSTFGAGVGKKPGGGTKRVPGR